MRRWIIALSIWLGATAAIAQVGQIPDWPTKFHNAGGGGGPIAFITSSAQYVGNNGGSGNFSGSYTGSSGTHTALIVCVVGSDTTDSSPAVTYNGVSATLASKFQPTSLRWNYQFYLLAPATGANTLAVTQTGGNFLIVTAAEYSGVQQSAQPDATANGSGAGSTTLATAITIGTANAWAMTCMNENGGGGAPVSNPSGNATLRATDTSFNNLGMYDSAGALSTGSQNITTQITSTNTMGNLVVSYKPG